LRFFVDALKLQTLRAKFLIFHSSILRLLFCAALSVLAFNDGTLARLTLHFRNAVFIRFFRLATVQYEERE
jgi:hypothetical protein